MPKFTVRMYCLVECDVEAESIDEVIESVLEMNGDEIDSLPRQIIDVRDILEVEEV